MVAYYRIEPFDVPGFVAADGVMVNDQGAWLGEWSIVTYPTGAEETVLPYVSDDDGEYIPAPADWHARVRAND